MALEGTALTDGGLETVLLFDEGFDLPCFASFPLLEDERGRAALRRYFEQFLEIAEDRGLQFVLDTVTWRANPDWGSKLGYDRAALAEANRAAAAFARELAAQNANVVVNGLVGPRGDGYVVGERMSAEEAAEYHGWQVGVLREAGIDRVCGLTLTYPEEAIGIIDAASAAKVPVVASFTVETDGRLPDGTPVAEAIDQVDRATSASAEFFMINCAHPSHIAAGLDDSSPGRRIGGIRLNASTLSHAELDEAEELDAGDPFTLARDTADLREKLPAVRLLGGCCGTDHRHVAELVAAWDQ